MEPGKFDQTRQDLVLRFGAVSFYPNSIFGIWAHEGTRYEDELVRLVVDVDDAPESRQYFVEWKPTLLERFEQIEIYVASYPIDIL